MPSLLAKPGASKWVLCWTAKSLSPAIRENIEAEARDQGKVRKAVLNPMIISILRIRIIL